MKRQSLRRDPRPPIAGAVIVWVALSPWLWGFAASRPAVANHVSLVLGIGPLALMIVALRPAAFVTMVAGLWLAVSPWLLGYATDHLAWANELIAGSLLIALSASAAAVRASVRAGGGQRLRPAGAGAIEPTKPPSVRP
jgi:SPW repeat